MNSLSSSEHPAPSKVSVSEHFPQLAGVFPSRAYLDNNSGKTLDRMGAFCLDTGAEKIISW